MYTYYTSANFLVLILYCIVFKKCNHEETCVKGTQDLSELFVTSRDYKFFQNKNQCKYVISQWQIDTYKLNEGHGTCIDLGRKK